MRLAIISSFRRNCGIGLYTLQFVLQLIKYNRVEHIIKRIYLLVHTDSDIDLFSPKLKIFRVIREKHPSYVSKMSSLLEKLKPDVIDVEWDHSLYSPFLLLGTYLFPILSKFKNKIFISFHSLYRSEDVERYLDITTGNKLLGKLGSKYYSLTKRFLLKNLSIGRLFTLYEYEQVKRIKQNFVLIPQGIEDVISVRSRRKDKNILTVFGFIRKTKDYKLAIESLSLLPRSFRLIIAGQPKDKELLRRIRLWVKEYGVKERVLIIPRLFSSKEKEFIMRKTDIILLPYLLISNSGVLLDGIKYCKPVVSTVLPQDITQLKIGVYTAHESKSFAEAIATVNNRYSEFQENIKLVQPRFLWKNIIPHVMEAYRKVSERV